MVCEIAKAEALDAIRKGLLVNQLAHLLRLDRAEVVRLMATQPARRATEQTGVSTNAEPVSTPRDAEQGAWVHLLEILLNEPGLLGSLSEWPDVGTIADARDRRIAEWIFECARKFGEFTLADVLARAQDGDDAARVAELAAHGQAVGNYEMSFQVALERLRQSGATLKLDSARRRLLETPQGEGDQLEVYADGVRRHRHFGPMRLVRQAAGQSIENKTATTQIPFEIEKLNSETL
jgi:hypothetical protein